MITQQHHTRRHAISPRDLADLLVPQQRTPRTAQRTVRRDMDALLPAEIHNVLLRQVRVIFDLVDGRHDGDVREEVLQEAYAVVGDADGFGFAGLQELLHLLVGADVGPGRVEVAAAVGVFGEFGVVAWWRGEFVCFKGSERGPGWGLGRTVGVHGTGPVHQVEVDVF